MGYYYEAIVQPTGQPVEEAIPVVVEAETIDDGWMMVYDRFGSPDFTILEIHPLFSGPPNWKEDRLPTL